MNHRQTAIANDIQSCKRRHFTADVVVLAQDNTITPLTADNRVFFRKLWLYPGKAIAAGGTLTANGANIKVGTVGYALLVQALTKLTRVGTAATAVCPAHGYADQSLVLIAGASPAGFNGTYVITVVDANTFTFVLAADPGADNLPVTATVQQVNKVTPDTVAPGDPPYVIEAPVGAKYQLADVLFQGTTGDGVYLRFD